MATTVPFVSMGVAPLDPGPTFYGLIGRYPMEDVTLPVCEDVSGRDLHGEYGDYMTPGGIAWTLQQPGPKAAWKSARALGPPAGAYPFMRSPFGLMGGKWTGTAEGWIRINDLVIINGGSLHCLFTIGGRSGLYASRLPDGSNRWYMYGPGGPVGEERPPLPENEWFHFAYCVNTRGTSACYINGLQVSQGEGGFEGSLTEVWTDEGWHLCLGSEETRYWCDANYSHWSVYDIRLTGEQVMQRYLAGLP